MKKIVAALAVISMCALPVVPVQAAGTAKDFFESCWFMPLLKDECAPNAADAPAIVTNAAKRTETAISWPGPTIFNCVPAAEGAKYLLECN